MIKHRKTIVSIILTVLILLGSVFLILNYNNNSIVFKITIHPNGTDENSYYIVLKKNSIIQCSVGRRQSEDINARKFLETIEKHAKKRLTEQQFQRLINLANEIQLNGNEYEAQGALGTYFVSLSYNNKVYETDYSRVENQKLKDLINEIIKISPLYIDLSIFG